MFDFNPGFGGPLRRDKVWFYFSARRAISSKWMATSSTTRTQQSQRLDLPAGPEPASVQRFQRETMAACACGAAAPKMKVVSSSFSNGAATGRRFLDVTGKCPGRYPSGSRGRDRTHYFPVERQVTGDVTIPLTNRLLIDAPRRTRSSVRFAIRFVT